MKRYCNKLIPTDTYEKLSNRTKTILFYIFRLVPIAKNKIVISNFFNKGYGDNPKYIAEEIIKQKLCYNIVWLVDNTNDKNFPKEIKLVKAGGIRAIYEMSTAKVWVDNVRKLEYVRKRKKQYYIQTWHGSLGVKKVEKDAQDTLSKSYLQLAKRDSKMANLFISNGNFITNLYRNSFWYSGEILEVGSPRNDILVNNQIDKNNIIQKLGLEKEQDKKIVLFAPTFRNSLKTDIYDLDYKKCIIALEKKFGGQWILLVRLHPNMADKALELNSNNVYNVSKYNDMQELLLIADVLITDYSSSAFDFALKKAPCFLYVPDEKEYMKERTFYFELEELPFPKADTNEQISQKIKEFNISNYNKEVESFFKAHKVIENGKASIQVVKRIKEIMGD